MSTPLTGGGLLSLDETVARLLEFCRTHPTRYLGILWVGGPFTLTRTLFAAPAASDEELFSIFDTVCEHHRYIVRATYPFGVNAAAADAWINAKERAE